MNPNRAAHTPGPWYVNGLGPNFQVWSNGPEHTFIAQVGEGSHDLEDAGLIAAAPELLAALKTIIGYNRQTALDKYGDAERAESWACVTTARAAIAKAEGR